VLSEHGAKIAPNTYWVAKKRPPSARAVRDEQLKVEIGRVYEAHMEALPRKVRHENGFRLLPQPRPQAGPSAPGRLSRETPSMAEYDIGEKPGKGRYCCTTDGSAWSVTPDVDSDVLPPCGTCGAGQTTKYQDC
jgi:transposase InsO family protein